MLELCAAYLIARNESHTAALGRLVRRLGFGYVEPLYSRRSFRPEDNHPALKFFLMYRHMDGRLMTMVRKVIRDSSDPNVRFSPIVLFTDECEFETYLGFIKMGFDDVLTLPDKREMLIQRLEGQVNTDHVYFETEDYLGPDRRRMEAPGHTDPRRDGVPRSYTRHTIHRTVAGGSSSIHRELIVHTAVHRAEQLARA